MKLNEYSINIWVNLFPLRSKKNFQDYDSKSKSGKKEKIDKLDNIKNKKSLCG